MSCKLLFFGLLGFLCKGGLGAKPPDPNTVAGSPEGGLERLGAHRKVQENLRVVMELVIFCNSFSIGNRLALPRASGRSRPPPTPPAVVMVARGMLAHPPCIPQPNGDVCKTFVYQRDLGLRPEGVGVRTGGEAPCAKRKSITRGISFGWLKPVREGYITGYSLLFYF